LPSNFAVPELTIVVVTVISTKDGLNASGVCMSFFFRRLDDPSGFVMI
jgi:hypothetical protein